MSGQRVLAVLAVALVSAAPQARAQRGRVDPTVTLAATARRDSCDALAQYKLAIAHFRAEHYDSADTVLQRTVLLDPQFAPGFLALGLVQLRNERFWERLRHQGGDTAIRREYLRRNRLTSRAYMLDPFVDLTALGLVARGGVPLAMRALMNGDYANAYRYADQAMPFYFRAGGRDSMPPLLLWIHAMSAAQTRQERVALMDVEALLRRSIAYERNDSLHVVPVRTNEYRYVLAALHQRLAENTLAIRMYEQVLENDIGHYMAHVQLARIAEGERDWFNAVRARQLALDVNPEDFTLHYDLGATLVSARRYADAEEALLRAQTMNACYLRTPYLLGVVQMQLGKAAAARTSLTRFLAIAPERMTTEVDDARKRLTELP